MQALIGMYCAGLDETYNAKITRPTIYHEYQRLCDGAYSYKTIETECIKTKEILSHIHIVNIADFMPESKIAKFYQLSKITKKNILTNELAYNDPKLAVYTMLRGPPREEEEEKEKEKEEYQFPFDSQDALGGNALKGTRKKKKRESKKKKSKRKYNKSKKQVKRKT
jgi:hypothetical protein